MRLPFFCFLLPATLHLLAAAGPAAAAPLDAELKGRVVKVEGRRVTLRYDFADATQLEDFVEARPQGLFGEGQGRLRFDDGRLVIEAATCVVHRLAAAGFLRARFTLKVLHPGDGGPILAAPEADGPYVLVDLSDRRFQRDGGLFWAACYPGEDKHEPIKWRLLAAASEADVARRLGDGKTVEVELAKDGTDEFLRLGTLHRRRSSAGKSRPLPRFRFGFWVQNAALAVDDLELTLELPEGTSVELTGDAAVRELSDGKLLTLVRDAPLSAEAAAALRELSRRGEDGWKRLFSLAKGMIRKEPFTALPVIRALAAGPEAERRELLRKLYPRRGPPDVQLAVLRGLARWYPEDAEFVHAGLALPIPGRVELFRDLLARGLPDEVVQALLDDDLLAGEAAEVLQDRQADVAAGGSLARVRALEALSPVAARAILDDFRDKPDWGLVEGLIGLLGSKEADERRGAYLLLMTLSGKDLPPDPDFWKSWLGARRGRYEVPPLSAPGVATAAIIRGVEFLRADLLEDGACTWPTNTEWPGCRVGATALAVYALRAADVPPDDPALQKALRTTLLVWSGGKPALRGDLEGYTYALSLLTLALRALDPEKFKPQMEILAKRIVEGQLPNGQWTYYCRAEKYGGALPPAGDNSNTQYAVLALRAAWRSGCGIPEETWRRNQGFWLKSMSARGGWGYGPAGSSLHEFSMTTAGVATLAICYEALEGNAVTKVVKQDKRVNAGLRRLGELLLQNGYEGEEIYAFYGVERACILAGVKFFDDYDWYHEGAGTLVKWQKESGAWGDNSVRGVTTGRGYGEAVDTAYALLFLKRATTGLPGNDGGGVVEVPGAERLKAKR